MITRTLTSHSLVMLHASQMAVACLAGSVEKWARKPYSGLVVTQDEIRWGEGP